MNTRVLRRPIVFFRFICNICVRCSILILTLSLLMLDIYGAPSKARNLTLRDPNRQGTENDAGIRSGHGRWDCSLLPTSLPRR
jgi:hypothetical protein